MKSFSAILRTYQKLDDELAQWEAAATSIRVRRRWSSMRILNDQAYFVVIFAQFEDYVKKQCRKLIDRKKSAARWTARRIWDSVDLDRLGFMKQVALLIDKATAEYGKVKSYYEVRCDIAHGTVYTAMPILVPTAAAELKSISRQARQ